ncbi:MAG TPA: hypothetical protein VKE22_25810 [Haliangiales bacterium]|nr:hypothetical protein [Haliangiales bacterium]
MLAPSDRPVGIQIVAGILFVVAAAEAIGTFFFGVGLLGHLDPSYVPGWIPPELLDLFRRAPMWYIAAGTFVLWPVKVGLLIAAGLAMLAQKRRGRLLVNLYVAASLIESGVTAAAMGADVRTLVGALFPFLVFLGVNKIFAEDLKY